MSVKNIWNEVPQTVHSKVLETLDSLENKKRTRMSMCTFYKAAVACLVIICVAGITACAAEAIHAYKERMTEMNRQLLDEYYNVAFQSHTISYSRAMTKEETKRYNMLKEEYLTEGHFPKGAVKYLENASDYRGKGVALHEETGILYIPDKELKDEEILQIIDFFKKREYSIYVHAQEYYEEEYPWMKRMHAMTNEEVEEAYLIMHSANLDVSGAFSRRLTEEEDIHYEELVQAYENENRVPLGEVVVIQTAEEYVEGTLAFCVENSTYYLPERVLTDEEFLQIIDLNHKAHYSFCRILDEIDMGFRTSRPKRDAD
ncbi:MAG: hypothetical protein IKJ15_06695 [Lachnospiraceae bacterium]|nr:hypothetical protein [Lachnospiraceae bacterium]MBR3808040.1 hypothetical protein [Lachnospiraceae bacterium]